MQAPSMFDRSGDAAHQSRATVGPNLSSHMHMGQLSSSRSGLNSSQVTDQSSDYSRTMCEMADANSSAMEQARQSITETASKVEGAKTEEERQQIMLEQFIDLLDKCQSQIIQMQQGFSDLPAARRSAQRQISESFCDVVRRTLEMTPQLYCNFTKKRTAVSKFKRLHEQLQTIPIPGDASAPHVPDYLHVAKDEAVTFLQAIPSVNHSDMENLRNDYTKLLRMLRDEMVSLDSLAAEMKTHRNKQWWIIAGATSLVVVCVVGFLVCGGCAVGTVAATTKAAAAAWALWSKASAAYAVSLQSLAAAKAAVPWSYYLTVNIFVTHPQVLVAKVAAAKASTAVSMAALAFWGDVGLTAATVGVAATVMGGCVATGIDQLAAKGSAERALKHDEAIEATALCLQGRYKLLTTGLKKSNDTVLFIGAQSEMMAADHEISQMEIDSVEWWREIKSLAFRSAIDEKIKELDQLCTDTKRLSSMTQVHIREWSLFCMDAPRMSARAPPADEAPRMSPREPPADEEGLCQICMDQAADTAVLPCGHQCACHDCLLRIVSESAAPQCPLCRGPIVSIARIYRS